MKTPTLRSGVCVVALCVLLALTSAPVVSAQSMPGRNWDVHFAGVIDTVPATAGDPWVVAGLTVGVDAGTLVLPSLERPAAGMWADVMATGQVTGSLTARKIVVLPADMRLKGPVQSLPADTHIGEWIVAGQSISVTAETRISDREPIQVGSWVEVIAHDAPEGLLALNIRASDVPPDESVQVYGAIKEFGTTEWNISQVPLAIDASTVISGTARVGLLARASASLDGSTLTARSIKVELVEHPLNPRPVVEVTGTIQALPPMRSFGVWVVAGQMVVVTPNTVIDQAAGPVVLGAEAKVTGWQLDDDKIMASSIVVLSNSGTAGSPVRLLGRIDGLPDSGLIGEWTVDGQRVQVTAETQVFGANGAQVGARALVVGTMGTDGSVTATAVWVMPRMPRHPQPPATPAS